TPIQEKALPIALAGRDLIGQAQTGTGKTAAFGIPMIEKINQDMAQVQGLVIAPTRELAIQVAEELNRIGQFKGVRALPIYGGQDIVRQIMALKLRPHIIVATPGRLMDHMRRKTVRMPGVKVVVLDEADEMLNMGFIEDIENILQEVPTDRQTLLFSATMPKPIQLLAQRFMREPELVTIDTKELTVANVEQYYIEVNEGQKFDCLCRLIDLETPSSAIVFGRTKRRVDELSEALLKRGYAAEGIHGDLTQGRRDQVMRKFRDGMSEILVATDVAARGLDISGVTHIYNFDIPQDPESYVHRIGRTGRAGKSGIAITFISFREMEHLRMIERLTNRKIHRKPIPTTTEALEGQRRTTIERLQGVIEEGNLEKFTLSAESLLEKIDSVTLVAAALKLLTKETDVAPITLTEEKPLRSHRPAPSNSSHRGRPSDNKSNYSSRPKRSY
ncbi:MAG: DEAD/DEAH box helicase, partial [bacterium]|nr:DEAD/DEAH box helicase [bacterium]